MLNKKIAQGMKLFTAAIAVSFVFAGCTSKVTEEQLKTLADLRKQEKNINEQIQTKQAEKNTIERELAARRAELSKCSENLDFVKKKLAQWPNVWPENMFYEEPKPEEE